MRRGAANPGTVDPDDAKTELCSGDPGHLRDLPPRARRPVHPDDRPTLRAAELGETDRAIAGYLYGTLEPRRCEQIGRRHASPHTSNLASEPF